MVGKTGIVFLLSCIFAAIFTVEAFSADAGMRNIAGKYTYGDSEASDGNEENFQTSGGITIKKSGADVYSVEIFAGTTGGGRGTRFCRFYGTGKISGDFLLVSNTLTYKGKPASVTFKIYLNGNSKLDTYAKEYKHPEFSKLKPGQLAVIDEGELPRRILDKLNYLGQDLLLPDGDTMYLGMHSFNGVYTKEKPASIAPAPQQAPQRSEKPKFSPSFDCAKASSAVERAICGDPALAELDVQMASQYKQALNAAANKEALKREQRRWLQQMHTQCAHTPDFACIQQHYRDRLYQLKQQDAKPSTQLPTQQKSNGIPVDEARVILQTWVGSHPFQLSSNLEPGSGYRVVDGVEYYRFTLGIERFGVAEILVHKKTGKLFHFMSPGNTTFEPLDDWYSREHSAYQRGPGTG